MTGDGMSEGLGGCVAGHVARTQAGFVSVVGISVGISSYLCWHRCLHILISLWALLLVYRC